MAYRIRTIYFKCRSCSTSNSRISAHPTRSVGILSPKSRRTDLAYKLRMYLHTSNSLPDAQLRRRHFVKRGIRLRVEVGLYWRSIRGYHYTILLTNLRIVSCLYQLDLKIIQTIPTSFATEGEGKLEDRDRRIKEERDVHSPLCFWTSISPWSLTITRCLARSILTIFIQFVPIIRVWHMVSSYFISSSIYVCMGGLVDDGI